MSLNRAMVIGRLGADPDLRSLPSGQQAASFSVATNEPYTDKEGNRIEHTEWHNIVAFGKLAETCAEYLKKGRQVFVEGRMRTREFEAKNDGGKRQRMDIVATRVQFLDASPADKASAATSQEHLERPSDVPF